MGAGISQMIRDDIKEPNYITNDQIKFDHAILAKTAGTFLRGAAGFAAPYILSAHYQNKICIARDCYPNFPAIANASRLLVRFCTMTE